MSDEIKNAFQISDNEMAHLMGCHMLWAGEVSDEQWDEVGEALHSWWMEATVGGALMKLWRSGILTCHVEDGEVMWRLIEHLEDEEAQATAKQMARDLGCSA